MASTFHLNCPDGGWFGGSQPADGTCTGNAWTMTGTGNSSWHNTSPASVFTGGTAYLSFTYSGSGAVRFGDHLGSNDKFYTSSQTSVSMGTQAAGYMTIYDNATFVGTLTNVCVTDTPGACESGGVNANFLAFM